MGSIGRLLLVAGALAACGCSGGDGGARQAYVEVFADGFESEGASRDDAECIAAGFVDMVGVELLQEIGSPDEIRREVPTGTPADMDITLDEDQVDDWISDLEGCMDFADLISQESGGRLDASCVEDALIARREVFIEYFTVLLNEGDTGVEQQPGLFDRLNATLSRCT